jgi:Sigma-54 interaction domain
MHAFWLLLPFEHVPWFKPATLQQRSDVQWPTPNHLGYPHFASESRRRGTCFLRGCSHMDKPKAVTPDTLQESEFFVVATGAYTGADRKGRVGKFKRADGGTLFLDEIGAGRAGRNEHANTCACARASRSRGRHRLRVG